MKKFLASLSALTLSFAAVPAAAYAEEAPQTYPCAIYYNCIGEGNMMTQIIRTTDQIVAEVGLDPAEVQCYLVSGAIYCDLDKEHFIAAKNCELVHAVAVRSSIYNINFKHDKSQGSFEDAAIALLNELGVDPTFANILGKENKYDPNSADIMCPLTDAQLDKALAMDKVNNVAATMLSFNASAMIYPEVRGDANGDGEFTLSDLVWVQKAVHGAVKVPCTRNADLCRDGNIDIFDLCLMKQELINNTAK